jgi:hypothetical protein
VGGRSEQGAGSMPDLAGQVVEKHSWERRAGRAKR